MTDVETVIAARDIAVAAVTTTAANVDLATQQADRAEVARDAAVAPTAAQIAAVDADAASAFRVQQDARLTNTIATQVPDATTTTKGRVELATSAETVTGTDAVRAVTPAGAKAAIDAATARIPIPLTVDELTYPVIIGHRSGHLLYPEESLEGYRACAQAGFGLEPDLYVTSDGKLVCCHDSTVDRTMTGGTGSVSSFSLAQWRQLRIKPAVQGGIEAMPVEWDNILREFGGRAIIWAEPKNGTAKDALIASVVARGLQRSVVLQSSTYSRCTDAVAAGIPALYLSDTIDTGGSNPTAAAVFAAGIKFVGVSTAVTGAYITALKAAGLKVLVYVVSNTVNATTWLTTNGADGIFSDDPWHVVGLREKRNSDPFRSKVPWPGWCATTNTAYLNETEARYGRDGEFGLGQEGVAGKTGSVVHRWAGRRGPRLRIRWRVRYAPTTTTDLTRWGGSVYVGALNDQDTPFTESLPGENGYHAFIRRNGFMYLYRVDGGVSTSLGTDTTGTTIAAYTDEGYVDLELTIDGSNVVFKDLTHGKTITAADTTYRPTDARIASRWAANHAYLSNMSIEDLP